MKHLGNFIGSILILTGTAIGAGMLALPMISAPSGFINASVMIICIWALMTITALLLLEVNLAFKPPHNNYATMAYQTLGRPGQIIAWITCLLLLYSLAAAYISGNSSLLTNLLNKLHVPTPSWINALLFTCVFGTAVFWSTHAVDLLNRWCISIKGLLLVAALILLAPHIKLIHLINSQTSYKYLWAAAPIFLTSFGFHTVIPSLSSYIGPKPKLLKWIIIIGAGIPMIIYILWLTTTLGILPLLGQNSFHEIAKHGDSVSYLVNSINFFAHSRFITALVNGFANIAMTTSFLGVSLGLFDFLADGFNRSNTHSGRFQTALLTFAPPLIFAWFYPKGFILALGYAAIFVAILEIIIPALMVYQIRRSQVLNSPYRLFGGNLLLIIIFLCGSALIILQLLGIFNFLPKI